MKNTKSISRRDVLAAGAATTAAFNLIPSRVLGQDENGLAPSDKLNIGFIGVGGKGMSSIHACSHHNIYALCDVDSVRAAKGFQNNPSAKRFDDWRVMLDKEAKNLDAVLISTPDHTHAVTTMAAMKLGLPVYCEKPLTRTISEARILTEYARKNKIVTQMGNQGHATEGARLANEWVQAGLLGEVREVHCWSDRPGNWWTQGIVRPPAEPVPETLNWDVWQGPAAEAPFSSEIVPFKWRAFWEYGAGALGDMGAHIMDHPVWALRLGPPLSVEVEFDRKDSATAPHTYPGSTVVTYKFAARGKLPPVTLKWFDGKNLPPRPKDLEDGREMPTNGIIYYGSKRNMMQRSHGGVPRIFPETEMRAVNEAGLRPAKTMPRSPGHHEEWIQAIKANDFTGPKSNFDYAGPLTETMLLGCVATRIGSGTKLKWDSKQMMTDNELANRYVRHEYRKGWSL